MLVSCARCYSCLHCMKSCRHALIRSASDTLVNSLIVSRLDYCNSFLAGCNKQLAVKLQHVLNCAARVTFRGDHRDHVTPLLHDQLCWLRVRQQIMFKMCLLFYKAMNGLAPSYIQDLYVPVTTISIHAALHSAACWDLILACTRWHSGNPAFCIAGPAAWNSLPSDIQTASALPTFKNHIKTQLFSSSVSCSAPM